MLVLRVANLLADGFSMGRSSYLSRRSEIDYDRATGDDREAGGKSATSTAVATFGAFVVAGWTPPVPYLLAVSPAFPVAVGVTGCAFFAVGASRSLVVDRGWPRAGAEMLAVGMLAAGVAFGVGRLLEGVA